ncbi:MAG: lipopolysaccharide biosynthesis protein [Nocardioides sp.]
MTGAIASGTTSMRMPPRTLAVYFMAKLVPGVLTMMAVPMWVRLVGFESYGRYALAWAVAVCAASLGTGWLRQSALRFVGSEHGSFGLLPVSAIVVSIIAAGGFCAVSYGIVLEGASLGTAALVGLFGSSIAVAAIVTTVLQRDARSRTYNLLETIKVLATVLLGAAFITVGFHGAGVIVASATVANVCGAAALVPNLRRSQQLRRSESTGTRPLSVLPLWWKYGWPMSLWLGLSPVLLYLDRMVLAMFADAQTVGRYAAVSDLLVRGVAMLAFPVTMALHPLVMRAVNDGRRVEALHAVKRWTLGMLLALALGTASAIAVGPFILGALLGTEPPSRAIVVPLLLGAGLWQVAQLAHKPMEVNRQTALMLGLLVAAVALEVAVALGSVRMLGDRGVALGLVVGAVSYLLGVAWFTLRRCARDG